MEFPIPYTSKFPYNVYKEIPIPVPYTADGSARNPTGGRCGILRGRPNLTMKALLAISVALAAFSSCDGYTLMPLSRSASAPSTTRIAPAPLMQVRSFHLPTTRHAPERFRWLAFLRRWRMSPSHLRHLPHRPNRPSTSNQLRSRRPSPCRIQSPRRRWLQTRSSLKWPSPRRLSRARSPTG